MPECLVEVLIQDRKELFQDSLDGVAETAGFSVECRIGRKSTETRLPALIGCVLADLSREKLGRPAAAIRVGSQKACIRCLKSEPVLDEDFRQPP